MTKWEQDQRFLAKMARIKKSELHKLKVNALSATLYDALERIEKYRASTARQTSTDPPSSADEAERSSKAPPSSDRNTAPSTTEIQTVGLWAVCLRRNALIPHSV